MYQGLVNKKCDWLLKLIQPNSFDAAGWQNSEKIWKVLLGEKEREAHCSQGEKLLKNKKPKYTHAKSNELFGKCCLCKNCNRKLGQGWECNVKEPE